MLVIVQLVIVFFVGAALGSLVNWGIYRLAFEKRCISPWGPKHPDASERKAFDYLPVIGWVGAKRDESVHGIGFWARPMALELLFGAGLAAFYFWHFNIGLLPAKAPAVAESNIWIWFLMHGFLILLLTIATFIDFDEKTIPDEITITGTMFALIFAALVPDSRLPELTGNVVSHLHFCSPQPLAGWTNTPTALIVALGCLTLWCVALVVGGLPIKFGRYGTVRNFFPLLLQPKRKTKSKFELRERSMNPLIKIMGIIWLLGTIGIVAAYYTLPETHWTSLVSSLLGMTFGLLFVWAIRIVAGTALGKEAMGFGDVTLMAMIGAFLGWQAALLTFGFAPFAAVIIAIAQVIAIKKPVIAFGPYLSLGAVVVLIGWAFFWNDWARPRIFILGDIVLYIIGGSLVLMFLMLSFWSRVRPDHVESEP
jgi:prepilin signal peptidase PulO-like enzyme (type II secretory pathway)